MFCLRLFPHCMITGPPLMPGVRWDPDLRSMFFSGNANAFIHCVIAILFLLNVPFQGYGKVIVSPNNQITRGIKNENTYR